MHTRDFLERSGIPASIEAGRADRGTPGKEYAPSNPHNSTAEVVRVQVVLPALNEAGNIRNLVGEALALSIPGVEITVLVVDNGSSDDTARQARMAGAKVVQEPRRGYGYACAAGVAEASEADIIAFLDADYSSLPGELPILLEPLLSGEADLVLGSRERGEIAPGAMLTHQRFGNRMAAWLIRRLYGIPVTDLGPYRAIRRDLLESLEMHEMTYGWPTEMTVKAARRKARLEEVPVSWHPRAAGSSKVSGTLRGTLLAAWHILRVTLVYAIRPLPREAVPMEERATKA
jgi:hypothetical protein